MALIVCPECGEKISSKAGRCVHCGYKFTICPECETILDETATFCPECGFEMNKNKANNNANTNVNSNYYSPSNSGNESDEDSFAKVMNLWKSQSPRAMIYNNKAVIVVYFIVYAALMAAVIVPLFQWVTALREHVDFNDLAAGFNKLEKWAVAPELMERSTIMIWILIALYVGITIFADLGDHNLAVDFLNWSKNKNYNYIELIKKSLKKDFSSSASKETSKKNKMQLSEDIKLAVSSFSYFKNPTSQGKHFSSTITCIIISSISSVGTGLFILNNVVGFIEQFFKYSMLSDPATFTIDKFEFVDWYLLIIGVAAGIVEHIYKSTLIKQKSRAVSIWAKENLGEEYSVFKLHVLPEALMSMKELKEELEKQQKDEKDRWDHRV